MSPIEFLEVSEPEPEALTLFHNPYADPEYTGPLPVCEDPFALPPLTDAEAHALIGRFARLEDEERALKANYAAMLKDLEHRRQRLAYVDNAEERLAEWTRTKLKGKSRSHRTLQGVVSFRTVPGRVTVTDDALALAWAKEHRPTLVVTTEKVDVKALKPEAFETVDTATGEATTTLPPGLALTEARETFSVKSGAKDTPEGDE